MFSHFLNRQFTSKPYNEENISRKEFELILLNAVDSLFGEYGSNQRIHIIKYHNANFRSFIRISAE